MAGCAAPVGDFGRRDEGIFATTLTDLSGPFSSPLDGPKRSTFVLTDDERDLRNIGWDLARPPDRDVPGNAFFEFAWWRALPDNWYREYPKAYYAALLNLPVATHETRYARLSDQARNDAVRLPRFRLAATVVAKADGARKSALASLNADSALQAETERRIAENKGVVRSVCQALTLRREAYRYALGRLVLETPSPRAIDTEAAIDAMAWETTACEPASSAQAQAEPPRREPEGRRQRLPPLISK